MIRRPPRSTLFPYTTLSDLQLRDNFAQAIHITDADLLQGTLTSPKEAGQDEAIILDPQAFGAEPNGTYYIAIKAINHHSNSGEMSNMAAIHITAEKYQPPDPQPTPIPTPGPGPAPSNGPGPAPGGSGSSVVIVGVLSALVIASVVALTAVGTAVTVKNENKNKVTPIRSSRTCHTKAEPSPPRPSRNFSRRSTRHHHQQKKHCFQLQLIVDWM